MLLISNNADSLGVDYPENAVIRINTAWVNTVDSLRNELVRLKDREIYLDYPIGRSKPPCPQMSWSDILLIANEFDNVKYFAWSNAENADDLEFARMKLVDRIKLVPKIETLIGVLHLDEIVKAAKTDLIMLDKEDLYVASKSAEIYSHFLEYVRKKTKELNIEMIELKGIIFS